MTVQMKQERKKRGKKEKRREERKKEREKREKRRKEKGRKDLEKEENSERNEKLEIFEAGLAAPPRPLAVPLPPLRSFLCSAACGFWRVLPGLLSFSSISISPGNAVVPIYSIL